MQGLFRLPIRSNILPIQLIRFLQINWGVTCWVIYLTVFGTYTLHPRLIDCCRSACRKFAGRLCPASVTPAVVDNWVDVNNDAQFDPDIDTWTDGNGNGTFDPVWIAGFQKSRAAQGVKDDLMAVAVVIDDGDSRIAIVALDTIGLMRKFVLDVRQSVPAEWGIDYLMVHATHNHEGRTLRAYGGRDYSAAV